MTGLETMETNVTDAQLQAHAGGSTLRFMAGGQAQAGGPLVVEPHPPAECGGGWMADGAGVGNRVAAERCPRWPSEDNAGGGQPQDGRQGQQAAAGPAGVGGPRSQALAGNPVGMNGVWSTPLFV